MVAGSLGMLCYYAAIHGAALSQVMPIAFTAPLFGVLAGLLSGTESLTPKTVIGMLLTIGGVVVLTTA